ncbi:MAG: precorrin-6y C5,15-methyltransferase (decarboxylating) subunit CbiE [Victivallales bacterium]|nr:precorrin-6y C5,15-methyltransferase (decarboxylating) subunit CbiE [Victivallales bacterium]
MSGDRVLSEEARGLLAQAEVVAGGRRLLEAVELPSGAQTVVLGANAVEAVAGLPENKRVVVLASGDPLYCGIGGTLTRVLPTRELRFHPAPTAFQELFARLKMPWDGTSLFTVHGKTTLPWRAILRAPRCAIYCDNVRTAQALATELIQRHPMCASRPAACGCDLGTPEEFVFRGTLEEISQQERASRSLSMLVLLPGDASLEPSLPLGLPDETYRHEHNMITHPETRSVVLSKLRCGSGVLWDLGAASGSVGLEAAGLSSTLEVYAIERKEERFAQLQENLAQEGLPRVHAFLGDFSEVAETLPAPDRIFLGGGSRGMLEWAFERLRPGGRMVVTAVLAETVAQLCTTLQEHRTELLTLQVSRVANGLFKAENPITIAVFVKEKQG